MSVTCRGHIAGRRRRQDLNSGPTLKPGYFSLFTVASEIGGRVNRKDVIVGVWWPPLC